MNPVSLTRIHASKNMNEKPHDKVVMAYRSFRPESLDRGGYLNANAC